ncbi:MAG: hypothetical protein SYNGOMJ08_00850 [Candidatus Syntrophoarchaeum sp. GoM_oil]|nr:MAG: hypothetical protein SYNGOMJ08_00850 [Candidatus Syntrophoarchaeum sp. GoM_oil]
MDCIQREGDFKVEKLTKPEFRYTSYCYYKN